MEKHITESFRLEQMDDYILLIYHTRFADNQDDADQARAVAHASNLFLENVEEPSKILVDATEVEINPPFTKDARDIYIRLTKHPKIDRVAMVGKTEEHTNLIKLFFAMRGILSKKKISWFSNIEEAKLWLSI